MSSVQPRLRTLVRRLSTRLRRWLTGGDSGWWESAGGLVFNHEQEVALIRQGRRWSLPKGRRDPGEALAVTARREVHEETGVRARIIAYLGVVEGLRHDTHYFLMAAEADDGVHDDEVDEVRFAPRKKAKRLLRSGSERRLLMRALDLLDRRALRT